MATASRPNGTPRSTMQLNPMDVPKASDVLVHELRERILSGALPEGSTLPPERELVAQTKMSRTTVREALRILEVQGLVRIRAGRAGGAFVQRPDHEAVASSVSLLIRGRQIRLDALLETREAIEPVCARLAAQHRTDADLEAMARANETMGDARRPLADFLQDNVAWHVAVATASHNELITAFMVALSRTVYTLTDNETFVDAEVRSIAAKAHRSITNAIRKQDAEAAARRMTRHLHEYAKAISRVEKRTEIAVPD